MTSLSGKNCYFLNDCRDAIIEITFDKFEEKYTGGSEN